MKRNNRTQRALPEMVNDSDTFRENAENCLHLAENAADEPTANRYRRMAQAWTALATEQDWLDGHMVQTQTERASHLAEGAIDGLSDERASGADVNDRKSQLVDGPAEFRNTRIDNN